MTSTTPIAVLGAGSWGTALAIQLARNNQIVHLWGRDATQIAAMQTARCNKHYLPDILFPEKLKVIGDLAVALKDTHDILLAVPSHVFRITLKTIQPFVNKHTRLIWATKGLDAQRHQLLHEVVTEELGELPMAVLSGPSFAKEVAQNLPTAITLASHSTIFISDLTQRLHSKNFRIYTSEDLAGVELAGAMKNVLAIAVGIADGLGFGANARAALITRGLAEMMRLGLMLGSQRETFMGLAGLGDLVLTCTDNQSRNRRFGLAVGSGAAISTAEKNIGQVVEGIHTAKEIYCLAKQKAVEVPISEQIYRVLHEGVAPREAVHALLSREQRGEGI
jgi:glycerol-3-phosphate dehydrogenase (NAD(P)+)